MLSPLYIDYDSWLDSHETSSQDGTYANFLGKQQQQQRQQQEQQQQPTETFTFVSTWFITKIPILNPYKPL